MFVLFDEGSSEIVDGPSNVQHDGWLPISMPPKRTSPAQQQVFEVVDGVVVGALQGSDNPKDAIADRVLLDLSLEQILQLPLAANDGKVFQFDTKSESIMSKIVVFLKANNSLTTDWRLLDNSTVTVNGAQLEAYYNELVLAQAARGFMVDPEYIAFKNNLPTLKELGDWIQLYSDNPNVYAI